MAMVKPVQIAEKFPYFLARTCSDNSCLLFCVLSHVGIVSVLKETVVIFWYSGDTGSCSIGSSSVSSSGVGVVMLADVMGSSCIGGVSCGGVDGWG